MKKWMSAGMMQPGLRGEISMNARRLPWPEQKTGFWLAGGSKENMQVRSLVRASRTMLLNLDFILWSVRVWSKCFSRKRVWPNYYPDKKKRCYKQRILSIINVFLGARGSCHFGRFLLICDMKSSEHRSCLFRNKVDNKNWFYMQSVVDWIMIFIRGFTAG